MEETSCRTIAQMKVYYNTWVIEDFFRFGNTKLKSATFNGTNPAGVRLSWYFSLQTEEEGGHIKIVVHSDSGNIKQHCEIELDKDNYSKISGILGQFTESQRIWIHYFKIREFVANNSFTLRFKVSFITDVLERSSPEKAMPLPPLPDSTLVENFGTLFHSRQFSDLSITVGRQTFRAHKAVLVVRSKVFAAMFQNDMQESQRNEVTIEDMEPEVFGEVLRFIYTDKVEGLPRIALQLLAVADRYDLARLKVMCEVHLFGSITAESATRTLLFADLHRAKELRAKAVQFIGRNLKAVTNWGEFCAARPDLVAEILSGAK